MLLQEAIIVRALPHERKYKKTLKQRLQMTLWKADPCGLTNSFWFKIEHLIKKIMCYMGIKHAWKVT